MEMEEAVAATLEDLKGLIASMPEDVVITVPLGKEGEPIGQEECF